MHKKLAEAALFMSTKPLGLDELAKILGVNSLGFVKQVMEDLQKEYEDRGTEVVNTQDGWRIQVKQELLPKVAYLTPYHDLSEGMKRTLALVVYKEPIKQSQIIKTQGNKAYSYVKELSRKGLVRAEKDGRTKILHLTPEFERYFGEERKRVKERMDTQLQQENQQNLMKQVEKAVEQPEPASEGVPPSEEPKKYIQKQLTEEKEAETEPTEEKAGDKTKEKGEEGAEAKKPVIETGEIKFEELKRKSSKTK